jgi:hypothetical protein
VRACVRVLIKFNISISDRRSSRENIKTVPTVSLYTSKNSKPNTRVFNKSKILKLYRKLSTQLNFKLDAAIPITTLLEHKHPFPQETPAYVSKCLLKWKTKESYKLSYYYYYYYYYKTMLSYSSKLFSLHRHLG